MFGFVSQTPKLDNTLVYDTYIKMVSPLKRVGEVLEKTLQYFGWRYVALFGGAAEGSTWDKIDELWTTVENQLKANFTITTKLKYEMKDPDALRDNLKHVSLNARIIILICSSGDAKSVLLEAERQGLTNGNYVFFIVQQFEVSSYVDTFWKDTLRSGSNNRSQAYEFVFMIAVTTNGGYTQYDFIKQVFEKLKGHPFYSTITSEDQVSPYSAYLHDAVILYALSIKQLLRVGKYIKDGKALVNQLRGYNKTRFYGITGLVSIDEFGERYMDYSVYDLQPSGNTSGFIPVLQYDSYRRILSPTREFAYIRWPDGTPTKDRPNCGFHGELCLTSTSSISVVALIVTLLATFLVAVAFVTLLMFQKGKLQRKVDNETWWRINYNNIVIMKDNKVMLL
ncbi:hypothetical protein NDU88_006733 [Pleurodeles waltl]|uniref:Receptor ligand binding region domain-containing protein n=1 Tax=Pleurodeles waltl TaxID=8319 RepID=A0AAV7QMM4_PLEWA|nr:hypothetical protein NDU88_006733 [Pleurodeles waltl]